MTLYDQESDYGNSGVEPDIITSTRGRSLETRRSIQRRPDDSVTSTTAASDIEKIDANEMITCNKMGQDSEMVMSRRCQVKQGRSFQGLGSTDFTRYMGSESDMENTCSVSDLLQLDSRTLLRTSDSDVKGLCERLYSVDMTETYQDESMIDGPMDEQVTPMCPIENLDPSVAYTQDKDGDTMLHIAIILQEMLMAMILIKKAASYTWLSFKNHLCQTPIHLAVLTNQKEIVRKLMTSGADVVARDREGNTALHLACRDGQTDIAKTLLQPVRYNEVTSNTYEIPYQRIPQDFSITNYEGETCLHLAATNGHLDIVNILIDHDVELNMREVKTGRSILHNACLHGDVKLVRLLLGNKRCNMNAKAYDGLTPFDLARLRNQDDICMILAAAGARYGDEEVDSD